MDNMCTVYDINNRDSSGTAKMVRELMGYEGFLSCCRFVDDSTLVTGSGDQMLTKWDLITGKKVHLRSLLSPFCSQIFFGSGLSPFDWSMKQQVRKKTLERKLIYELYSGKQAENGKLITN